MNVKKAIIIGALALMGAAPLARAQSTPSSVTIEANTAAKDLAADALLANQYRMLFKHGDLSVKLESNEGKPFGHKDFGLISYNFNAKGWDITPAFRSVSEGTQEVSLYAGKNHDAGRFNALAVKDDAGFCAARFWNTSKTIDFGAGMKKFDGCNSKPSYDFVGGVHKADGSAGLWLSKAVTNVYGLAVTIDKPDFGTYLFAKDNIDSGSLFAVAQTTWDNDGKRIGGFNNASAGFGTAQVTGNQKVHPFIANMPSSVFAGGKWVSELGYVKNSDREYFQAQVGHAFKTDDSVYGFALGGRVEDGKVQPVGEVAARVPTKNGSLEVTVRSTPELSASAVYNVKF